MRQNIISKEALVDYAEEIIKEKGLAACTIRALAKEANVAVGTLYNYFPSHKLLLEAVFYNSWRKTITRLNDVMLEDLIPSEKFLKFFKTIDNDIENRQGIGKAIFKSPFNVTDMTTTRYKSFVEIHKLLTELLSSIPGNDKISYDIHDMNSLWILMGHVGVRQTNNNIDLFYQEVLHRFFN